MHYWVCFVCLDELLVRHVQHRVQSQLLLFFLDLGPDFHTNQCCHVLAAELTWWGFFVFLTFGRTPGWLCCAAHLGDPLFFLQILLQKLVRDLQHLLVYRKSGFILSKLLSVRKIWVLLSVELVRIDFVFALFHINVPLHKLDFRF